MGGGFLKGGVCEVSLQSNFKYHNYLVASQKFTSVMYLQFFGQNDNQSCTYIIEMGTGHRFLTSKRLA